MQKIRKSRTELDSLDQKQVKIRVNHGRYNARRERYARAVRHANPDMVGTPPIPYTLTDRDVRNVENLDLHGPSAVQINPLQKGMLRRLDRRVDEGRKRINEMLASYGIEP